MNLTLKTMDLTDFKGVNSKHYDFANKTVVSGKNGLGKTTMADAFYWLLTDKNYSLASNPNIRPSDGRECIPTVRLLVEIDGSELELAKMQKARYSKPDAEGKRKVTLSNAYEINSVEYTERDFKKYLTDKGMDFNTFLQLSNPNTFIKELEEKKTRDLVRDTLFSMTDSNLTDLDVARSSSEMSVLAGMLEKWTVKEIESMQKSTLRKIREDYGKDGEILRGKIIGLESAKVRIDVSEMELGKNAVLEKIKENRALATDVQALYDEQFSKADGILQLKFRLSDMQAEANAELNRKKSELKLKKVKLSADHAGICTLVTSESVSVTRLKNENERFEKKRAAKIEEWKKFNSMKFDEADTICRLCGQAYPEERIADMRRKFEENKLEALAEITKEGMELKTAIDENNIAIESGTKRIEELTKQREEQEIELSDISAEIASLPENIDISECEEYKKIVSEIAEKETHLNQCKSFSDRVKDLDAEHELLLKELRKYEDVIAKASNDDEIDSKIEALKEKQIEYEQSIADCENVLNQIKELSKIKNNLLEESINKNFELVKFILHDYQKNGEYKEVCIPTINGKRFGEHTNTGLEFLAKLDIIKGLQKYYGQYYPVFVDCAESLDTESLNAISMDCQIVMLRVTDDKELKMEE